jgi:dihydrofolate reductase
MATLKVFNQISLDGFFVDARNDMSWAHKSDPEWMAFTAENAKRGAILLFGRITYEMMASFWPTPAAKKTAPEVAEAMNRSKKMVFSRTLKEATWSNTTLVNGDPAEAVRTMKQRETQDMVIMGSGRIVALLAQADLIDEYQMVVNPLILGSGRTMFDGVERRPQLKLTATRTFENGNVVLWYRR